MKRRFAMLLLPVLLLLAGCSGGKEEPLCYQNYPIVVTGELSGGTAEEGNCSVRLELTAPMQAKLQFEKPDSLKGYVFSMTPDGVTLSYGEISVPYKASGIPGGEALLPRMLSLESTMLTGSERKELNSVPVWLYTYQIPEGGTVRVFVDAESGQPLRFEGSLPGKDPSGEAADTVVFRVTGWNAAPAADSAP